jgi:hypothetical protein
MVAVTALLCWTGMIPGRRHILAAKCLIVSTRLFIDYSSNGGPLLLISDCT